jgi:hypothetical protein
MHNIIIYLFIYLTLILCASWFYFIILTICTEMNNINALHGLILIKIIISRFVGTGSFLIKYSNGHMKWTYGQLKKFLDYFYKTLFL